MTVKEGSTVQVEYTGKLADGTVFDTSEGRDPLQFTIGQQQVIPGFEEGVMGMAVGDSKEIVIEPDNAYGQPRDDLVQQVPRERLPQEAEVGSMLAVSVAPGQQIPATVKELSDESATLDLNHPLAGKTLHFSITVKDVQ